MATALSLDPTEHRLLLLSERGQLVQSRELTAIVGCGDLRINQQDEESVFLTPRSSPSYSQDGNNYQGELGYFPTESMEHHHHQMQSLSPPVTSYSISPGSPCDDYYRSSPYSPPYDASSSPHSLSCSSPHGSPSIPCTDAGHFSPYMTPETSMANLPPSTSLTTSIPYSVENRRLIYTSVPIGGSGEYYAGAPGIHSHWEGEGALPSFDTFVSHSEQPHIHHPSPRQIMEGEVPINIIDQSNLPMQPDMMQTLNYYPEGSPISTADSQHIAVSAAYCHEMTGMHMHPEMAAGVCLPPPPLFASHKPKPPRKPKKPKPTIQVNDEHIKDIPTSAQLWEFTLRVLKKPAYHYMVNWENRKEGLFRFHDANAFAALWGKHRNRPHMTYDKVARALRYYYKRDILNQVGGRLTYRFSKRLSKLYATEE